MPTAPLIAVIDDDGSFRTALVELLFSLGYGVRDFDSAEGFLAADVIDGYACIISDIHMPGMNGLDLQRRLKAMACRVPVIMITARLEPGLESQVTENGAICLLGKPILADRLIACLGQSIRP